MTASEEQQQFMSEAFNEARDALAHGEVPVGCVFVHDGVIIARGRNTVNATCNATRHAEINCVDQVMSKYPHMLASSSQNKPLNKSSVQSFYDDGGIEITVCDDDDGGREIIGREMSLANTLGRDVMACDSKGLAGLQRSSGSNKWSVFSNIDVYVTVEPCAMCADALGQLRVRSVTFGCCNERFGGCGSVIDVPKLYGYDVVFNRGVRKEEAVQLLKDFYREENPNAPNSKVKRKHSK